MPLRVIDLAGEPYDIGYAFGSQLADEVHDLAAERSQLCAGHSPNAPRDAMLRLASKHVEVQAKHLPRVHEEFCGIAHGAKISQEELLIGNGLTDFRDVLNAHAGDAVGCTSFLVKAGASADACTYLGQTWDMHATAEPFVVALRRKPADGPKTITLTTAGCLALIGMNEHGLAIGNNNLVPTDAKPGVIYLAMIHDFLSQSTFARGRAAITDAPRASGHNYYMAGCDGEVADIETTAEQWRAIDIAGHTYAHANHYEAAPLQPLEAEPPGACSIERKRRLSQLLEAAAGAIDMERLHEILSYRKAGDEGSLSRHGDVKSCAAAIMCPQRREVWLCQGPPDVGEFVELGFD